MINSTNSEKTLTKLTDNFLTLSTESSQLMSRSMLRNTFREYRGTACKGCKPFLSVQSTHGTICLKMLSTDRRVIIQEESRKSVKTLPAEI